jgi:predicted nucleic acid-binding protein
MTAVRYVLDANIWTALLKREVATIGRVREALSANAELVVCPVAFYEIYRGLESRDALRQMQAFLSYVAAFAWDDYTRADWEAAGRLWATARRLGHVVADADLLIAAYAQRRNAVVVTDNVGHFSPLGIPVQNWRR